MSDALRIREVFNEAFEVRGSAREECLERACSGDTVLRRRVEELLAAAEKEDEFLASPTGHAPDAGSTRASPLREAPGTRIGPYKLLQQIGEGGFGVVFLAEQEKPVQRRVALKIIKLGMDTHQVVARFEQERQALAMMEHPNIAKVFDAGATETGRPYFVMELVKGEPITHYCDSNNLSVEERLGLAQQVCHAIQHAHQKGIIHRDIKPNNVLVTVADGKPIPKVIDFGIAKATLSKLTEKTLFTEHRALIGTPEYMSPEQAGMTGVDIDTRSDIYSLGVLLYELLTGALPFDGKRLRSAAFGEIQRIIREEDPPTPSTRLSTLETLASVAAHRRTEPARLSRLVKGDLDWIVMKCLEKDRTRRYETANGLAADIQRHLDDEPVTAAAPSTGYKLRKFVKRNRARVIAAGILACALVLGVVGTTAGMVWAIDEKDRADIEKNKAALAAESEAAAKVRAQENEKIAKAEAKRAETITEFVATALRTGDAENVGGGHDKTILAAMDTALADIDSGRFKDDPATEAQLLVTIGSILENNGRVAQAEPLLRGALDTLRRVLGDEHPDTLSAIARMGDLLQTQGKLDEAEPYVVEVLETSRRVLDDEHAETLSAINNMGVLLLAQGKAAEAEPYFREALEKRRRVLRDEHPDTLISIGNMGGVLQAQGRLDEAEPYFSEALETCRRVLGDKHPSTLRAIQNVSSLLDAQGRFDEADRYFSEGLEMSRRIYKGDHPNVAHCLNNLATGRLTLGRAAEAEPLFVEALDMYQRLFEGDHPDVAKVLDNLAKAWQQLGRAAEAEPLLLRALEMRRRLYKGDHPDLATGLNNLANLRLALGRPQEAEPLAVEALEMFQRLFEGDHPAVADALDILARTRQTLGRAAEAEPLLARSVEIRRRIYKGDHPNVATGMNNLASARLALGRGAEAEQLLVESLEMRLRLYKGDHPAVATCMLNLAATRQALGKSAEARQGFDDAVAMLRRCAPDGSSLLARMLWYSGRARFDNKGAGDAAAALPELEEAVTMAEKFLTPEHPQLAEYRETLAKCRAASADQVKPEAK